MEQVMLDMIPTGAKAVCHVSQYDIGRTIRFNLRSNGTVYTLAGTETIKVYIKKPDGTTAERNIANTSSTYVDWVTGEGDCDQAGKCECELVITSGTTVIGSKNFTVKIEEDPYNDQGVVTETAGPAVIATFTTNVVDLLQEVKCSINPIQNGTPWIDSNEVNKEPYIKREVAGTATRIGNHLYDKLVGGTVAFNQLCGVVKNTGTQADVEFAKTDNNTLTLSGTATDSTTRQATNNPFSIYNGHKYLIWGSTSNKDGIALRLYQDNWSSAIAGTIDLTGGIVAADMDSNKAYVSIRVVNGTVTDGTVIRPQIIDLTAMFGSTIADYIYGLEQATAGAGVAWFKALGFDKDYYPYNAGELMSVKATAHVMKNASNTVIGNYALDSNLELRGIPKLVNNKLEYDGDTYESNGKVTRKYGIVDLGSVSWNYQSGNTRFYTNTFMSAIKGETTNVVCPIYTVGNTVTDNMSMQVASNGYFYVKNTAYTDPTAFKTAMNGVYLLYELATPTTEQASPFTNPQVCDENGTEEYTDSRAVAIPVGHETYQANICPIIGFDELNVIRAGVNIWDEVTEVGTINDTTGENQPYASELRTKNYTRCTPNTTYYHHKGSGGNGQIYYYDSNRNYIGNAYLSKDSTFTTPNNAYYFRFRLANAYGTTYKNDVSINSPSSDHDYHSYSGKLIKLEFDDTVFLAEVSCLNGVWKLKLLGAEVDLGDLTYTRWTDDSAYYIFYAPLTNKENTKDNTGLCSYFPLLSANATSASNAKGRLSTNNTACLSKSTMTPCIYLRADQYTTTEALVEALSGQKLVYELATPIEITLDETEQFESLIGVNNVWHDGNGNTEVKYLYNA